MTIIRNLDSLAGHGQTRVRRDAMAMIQAGIHNADPGRGTRRLIHLEGQHLQVAEQTIDLTTIGDIYFVGVGKGSYPIAEALEEILGQRIKQGVLVVKSGEQRRLSRIEVLEAGHPIPNEASIIGARRILDVARQAGERDLVFAGVTGGSSALVTLPPPGVTLEAIQEMTEFLLKCGATIGDMNTVRKHVCQIKGGRLIAAIQPALGITLTLDTAPDGLPWPDLCLPDPTTFADAIRVLHHFDLWHAVAPSIRDYLEAGQSRPDWETVKSTAGMKTLVVSVGDPVSACEAAAESARQRGYHPVILGTAIEGEAFEVGVCLAGIAKEILKYHRPFPAPCALISGGETTVTIREPCGKGGPNQELALGFACRVGTRPDVCCISVGTDGTDGPTDIAGGIVDGATLERAEALTLNLAESARRHDSATALMRLDDAIFTGHTGTNVLDLRVVVIGHPAKDGPHA